MDEQTFYGLLVGWLAVGLIFTFIIGGAAKLMAADDEQGDDDD